MKQSDINQLLDAFKKNFVTRDEFDERVGTIVEQKLDERITPLKDKISLLPTKEEFFARMDKLSGEYKKIDEAETLHVGTISDHTDQLENHEERIKTLERRHSSNPTTLPTTNL